MTAEQHMTAAVMAKVQRAKDLVEAGDIDGARVIRNQLEKSTVRTAPIGAIIVGLAVVQAELARRQMNRTTEASEGRRAS